jgi:hypothetical protein
VTLISHRLLRPIVFCVMLLAVASSAAFAQSQVRVTRANATIWQRDSPVVVAAIVSSGTVLEVRERLDEWYVVVVPSGSTAGSLGLIAVSQVEPVPGSGPLLPRTPETVRLPENARTPVASHPIELFGFADVGYQRWSAKNSFAAVLGSSSAPMVGGGVQVRVSHFFVEVAAHRFEKTGERVFVNEGDVFKLGIKDTVRVIPLVFTAGFRQAPGRMTAYAGAGMGRYSYRETSDFADPGENVNDRFRSYHALAGIEFTSVQWLRAAVEVQYTSVPNALGTSGAAAAFDEHNLGGVEIRLKILAGR